MGLPSPLLILTTCNLELALSPVPMPVMPSEKSEHWLVFLLPSCKQYGYGLNAEDVERIQSLMIDNRSECVTDGWRPYTIYGNRLVGCDPCAVAEILFDE
ncbi:hypothetical protein FEV13_00570 (plasmid) [Stutzerimonas degradans]|nr:hypothetical protein FEV13_00570 [Stutzerimonas degradans]